MPWGLGEAGLALGIFLFSQVLGAGILIVVARSLAKKDPLLFGIVYYQFIVLGVVLTVWWLLASRGAGLEALGFRFPGWTRLVVVPVVTFLAVLVGVEILYGIFNTFIPGYNLHGNAQQLFGNGPKHMGPAEKMLVFVWAAMEAPLTEETLFRGIVFQGIRQFFLRWIPYRGAVLLAAIVSGVLFGAAHFEIHTLPILALAGIGLAYAFQYGRSLYASALVHGMINASAVLYVFGHP